MNLYHIIKLIHVLAAMLAVGFNLSYIVWFTKGKMESSHLLFSLQGIRFMDNWIANPSYILSLLSGLVLSYLGHYNLLVTHWIFYSLILFTFMGIIGFGIYAPALKKQISILKDQGLQSAAYKKADKKQTLWGSVLFLLALVIVGLMVIKP